MNRLLTYVAPDETCMVFGSGDGRRVSDEVTSSYPSGTTPANGSEPVHLGKTINTEVIGFRPMVTPDGKYLFFSRLRGASWKEATAGDVYRVDAKILEQFRR